MTVPTPADFTADTLTPVVIEADPDWVTTDVVAEEERVNPITVRRWIAEHKVVAFRMPDRTLRVFLPSVCKYRMSITGLIDP
jgi:hypothetical protein